MNQIGTISETLAVVRAGEGRGLPHGHLGALGRDRGPGAGRPRGRHRRRADQGRLGRPVGAPGQVQPAPAHRGGARRRRVRRAARRWRWSSRHEGPRHRHQLARHGDRGRGARRGGRRRPCWRRPGRRTSSSSSCATPTRSSPASPTSRRRSSPPASGCASSAATASARTTSPSTRRRGAASRSPTSPSTAPTRSPSTCSRCCWPTCAGSSPYDRAVRRGDWSLATGLPTRRVAGRTLGIVGFGAIGQTLARKARGLDLAVIAHDADEARVREGGAEPVGLLELARPRRLRLGARPAASRPPAGSSAASS